MWEKKNNNESYYNLLKKENLEGVWKFWGNKGKKRRREKKKKKKKKDNVTEAKISSFAILERMRENKQKNQEVD